MGLNGVVGDPRSDDIPEVIERSLPGCSVKPPVGVIDRSSLEIILRSPAGLIGSSPVSVVAWLRFVLILRGVDVTRPGSKE